MSKKRRRVDPKKIRDHARKGGGGSALVNLPKGVEPWFPTKAGTYSIDVVPYEVTDKHHPSGIAEKGSIFHSRQFIVHRDVGPNNDRIVCPTSVGKKCPLHEHLAKLKAKSKGKKIARDLYSQLNGQRWTIFNIKHPKNPKKFTVLFCSDGKFWSADAGLKKELDEGKDSNLTFYECKGGKTLDVRFSEDTFEKNTYLVATRVDFSKRKDMDEDEVLEKVVNLDECLNVLSYKTIKKMWLGDEEDNEKDSDDDDSDDEDEKEDSDDSDDDDEDEDEDDDDDDEDEDEDDDSEDDDDDSEDEDDDDEDSDDDDDEGDDDEEDDSDDDDEDEDEDEDEDDDEDKEVKKKGKKKNKKK